LAASALSQAASALDDNFAHAVEGLFLTQGKIIVTGVGKSAHIAAKIAATLNSTGTSAMFMHAGEAMHGDVGAVNERDAVLCLSKSGSSDEVVALLPVLKQRDCTLVAMTAKHSSHGSWRV
jgi:arabinose-5-phosphate isomerase